MYRADGDAAIQYTVEDFLLYKESPFASWMERLTLENPCHGIAPDRPVDTSQPMSTVLLPSSGQASVESVPWSELTKHRLQADLTRAPQRPSPTSYQVAPDDVYVVKKMDDVERAQQTCAAMHRGVKIIANAQLSVGPLSCDVDLLIRCEGLSELGSYLYLPCDSNRLERPHRALALCYAADLLHSLQGTLPAQLLVIRPEQALFTLDTEEHIYHYRAVKQSFMEAQNSFRKHRMPKPEDSSTFGRWSQCANDMMKRSRTHIPDSGVDSREQSTTESPQVFRIKKTTAATNPNVDSDWPAVNNTKTIDPAFDDRLMTSNGSFY